MSRLFTVSRDKEQTHAPFFSISGRRRMIGRFVP
jgi:hypothetical protein